jgi:transposase InsO family protein
VDLCFVPVEHEMQDKLPAVSGSSGHLVIERMASEGGRPEWPGQVFADPELSFEAKLRQYIQNTQDRLVYHPRPSRSKSDNPSHWRKEWEGRDNRHKVLEQRRKEDAEWRTLRAAFIQANREHEKVPIGQKKRPYGSWGPILAAWVQRREQRRIQLQERMRENEVWHQRNQAVRAEFDENPVERAWFAVLVITDNCTRQCMGLPMFRSGARVNAQEVVDALRTCLPPELQFLISDQGTHFKNQLMAQLAKEQAFEQVLIYRHRPQSNGIAERFVRTFKGWLRNRSWITPEQLESLIAMFISDYNYRPHLGLAIPGLSPVEFTERFWLF